LTNTKMLINATRSQMLRVAIVEGTILQEYQVEIAEAGLSRGNIYRGVVANIQQSLNAAFIDIGEERHAFLPVADVLPSAWHKEPPEDARRPRIDQVLEKGKPILVQVTKDGVGQKGAALSTNIALAGRYLVLTPFDEVRGISRKAEDDDERKNVRERLKKLTLPEGCGVIVRTNGLEQNQTTLTKDLNALLRLWRSVHAEAQQGVGPKLIYSDQDLVVQMLRDYLDPEIGQVVVDGDEVFAKVDEYMKAFMPRSKTKLVRYHERLPLFSRYRIETQIDRIYERVAPLPGGGSIVIDTTEALTAVDVNSGRATRTIDHDESIFNINCEAAHEVARQLRLRDIGGLVVVDFIDMRLRKHQNKLEKVMREAMRFDKARYSVGRISPNGLLEINRQRIKQALRLRTHRPCPTCQGGASIPTPDFSALRILTRIEARASTGLMKSVTFALHPEIADALQNGHRRELVSIEQEYRVEIQVIAAPSLARTEERVDWVEREPGAEPVVPREPAIRAADLSRADTEADLQAATAMAAPRGRQSQRSESQRSESQRSEGRVATQVSKGRAVPERSVTATVATEENGDGEKTRRKRRRRRRRGGRGNGEEMAADVQLNAGAESRGAFDDGDDDFEDDEPTAQVAAEAEDAEIADDGEVAAVPEKKARAKRPSRRRGKAAPVEDEAPVDEEPIADADAEPDEEGEDESEGDEGGEGAAQPRDEGDTGEKGRKRRRRRRGGRGRRRKKELTEPGAAAPAGDGDDDADFEPDDADDDYQPPVAALPPPPVAAKAAGRGGRQGRPAKTPKATAPPAPPVAGQFDDDDDFPQPLTNEGNDPTATAIGGARGGRHKKRVSKRGGGGGGGKRGDGGRPAADYDERQPASNESALHRSDPAFNPQPAAPIGVITGQGIDRTASARLRWQWWGGNKGGNGERRPEGEGEE
jgi:ribonuclease E